jgi:hypothetical protein
LFSLIRDLKTRGCGNVYITHKMEEIERIADPSRCCAPAKFSALAVCRVPAPANCVLRVRALGRHVNGTALTGAIIALAVLAQRRRH